MKALRQTLRFIVGHPLNRGRPLQALARFASWQIRSRLSRRPSSVRFVGDTTLVVSRGMTGATGNVYCGLHEFEDMAFVLHALRPNDLFVDVGANVGSYTVLAAGAAGARVIAIEPDADSYSHLMANVNANHLQARVAALNHAVGATEGEVEFSSGFDTTNHVLAAGEPTPDARSRVSVRTLDESVSGAAPFLAKIDVEGYESEVLEGATALLESGTLQAIVMESHDSGTRYAPRQESPHACVLSHGFTACSYEPFPRHLTPLRNAIDQRRHGRNTLYVRDVGLLQKRVRAASRYHVLGRTL